MDKRLRSVSRLLKVQSDLHLVAERKLADLVRRETEVLGEKAELLGALNDHDVFYGSFIYPMAKRLRLLDEAAERIGRERERESRRVLQQAARKKRLERLRSAVGSEVERAEDARALLELIERSARPARTSPG